MTKGHVVYGAFESAHDLLIVQGGIRAGSYGLESGGCGVYEAEAALSQWLARRSAGHG